MSRPVVILAGGTGGHIFPGLAVAQVLRERGVPVMWIGARDRMETRLVPAHGIPIDVIDISGLRGKGLLALLTAPLRIVRAIWQAHVLLRRAKPCAVISFGGFAAGPGGLAAWLSRLPLLVHEQNSRPGVTNRILSRLAKQVLQGFPGSFPAAVRARTVGNPVRPAIAALAPPQERLAGREGVLRVLVLGGSQGAQALNRSVPPALASQGMRFDVLHQCGQAQVEGAAKAYAAAGVKVRVESFIDDITTAYAWADIVVCRAGALTLAELCAVGIASVLVPLPTAADDHQSTNASYLVSHDAALQVSEGEDFEARLASAIRVLADDPEQRMARAAAARALAQPDAAQAVAEAILMEAKS